MVHVRRKLHRIDSKLDIHIALNFAAALAVGELLGWLSDHIKAVIVQPVDQRADRRIFVIFQQSCIIKRAQKLTTAHKFAAQQLIVDIKPERFRGGV